MFQQQVFIINMVLMVLDALCVVLGGYAALYWVGSNPFDFSFMDYDTFNMSVLFVIFVNNYSMDKFQLYDERRLASRAQLALCIFKAVLVDFILLSTAIFLIRGQDYSRSFLIYFFLSTLFFVIVERYLADIYVNVIAQNGFNARKLLIVGDETRAQVVVNALQQQLSWGHRVVGTLPMGKTNGQIAEDVLQELEKILKETEVDEVIFAVTAHTPLNFSAHLDICCKTGITTRILPALWNPVTRKMRVEESMGIPFLTLHTNNLNAAGLFYKRVLDLVGGVVGAFFFLLLYPILAVAIKLDSPGPVLFKQERVGKNGRHFKLLKFRSMFVDAEDRKEDLLADNEMQGPMFKARNDPRITRVGAFLRKTSLDEFPQFINVLKGEMSLVGTRPPTPEEVQLYDLGHRKRLSAKPGITGLWQVSGRNRITDFSQVVQLDCQYLDNWRFLDDIKILIKTVGVVLLRKGAF